MQPILLFEPEIKIPHSDMKLFVACNNADRNWVHKREFYQLKNAMLERYGERNEYDLQIIERQCDTCNGTGWYDLSRDIRCRSCGNSGLYRTDTIALERWLLNGKLFHCPIGWVYTNGEIQLFNGEKSYARHRFIGTVYGLVKHPEPEMHPSYAFFCLLFKYDHAQFTTHLKRFSKELTAAERKKWGELSKECTGLWHQLQEWYGVAITDNLPF